MKRFLTTALGVSILALFSVSILFAGGDHCDKNKSKQVKKDNKKTCPLKKKQQVQKNTSKQNETANRTADRKNAGKKCDLKKKQKQQVNLDCAGKDCEYCSDKNGQVSDRHLMKLVDDTLATLPKNDRNVDQKKLEAKLKILRQHLRAKRKQLARQEDSGANRK